MNKNIKEARSFATSVLHEMNVAGEVDTLEGLIKRAICVQSDVYDRAVLTIAVAEVFAAHWTRGLA